MEAAVARAKGTDKQELSAQDGYARSVVIPLRGDKFNDVREEYSEMLQNQLAKGNNGLTKTKFLTFGIDADSIKTVKPRLERIEMDIMNNFKRLGVACAPMDGMECLRLLHGIFRMDGQEPFRFSWDWLAPSGLSTKDFIAPTPSSSRMGVCSAWGSCSAWSASCKFWPRS